MNDVENLKEHFKDMLNKLEHLGKINNMTKVDFIASLRAFEFFVRDYTYMEAIKEYTEWCRMNNADFPEENAYDIMERFIAWKKEKE